MSDRGLMLALATLLLSPVLAARTLAQGTVASAPGSSNQPEDATVTFYSGGRILSTLSPFSGERVFQGCVFEGDVRLTCLSWLRYAVVPLRPGAHTFSASLSTRHGALNSQLPVVLEAGRKYYLRVATEHKNDVVPTTLHSDRGFLELVSCETAVKDTADFAPADARVGGKDWKRRPRDGAPACSEPAKAP